MTRPAFSSLLALCVASGIGFVVEAAEAPLEDDPKAHAIYDLMVKTMRDAESLSFESDYRWEAQGRELSHVTYRVWLKKPNQFRVEASRFGSDKITGVLVGDGDHLWVYWPGGKPRYAWEASGTYGGRAGMERQLSCGGRGCRPPTTAGRRHFHCRHEHAVPGPVPNRVMRRRL